MQRLVKATIDPAVANAILERAGDCVVDFDGFGRIVGFSTQEVSPDLVAELEGAVIEPLATTNARISREASRPERDILTRAMHLLGMSNDAANVTLLREARNLFLSGSFSRKSVAAFINKGIESLERAGDVLLHDQFRKLAVEIAKPVTTAQLADNIYGRTFESILVDELVRNPPPSVMRAARELGNGVLGTLGSFRSTLQDTMLKEMASVFNMDKRPWFDHCPELKAFVESPSMESLQACLAATSSGIDCIKVPCIAARMALSIWAVACRELVDLPVWLTESHQDFYENCIEPSKPSQQSKLRDVVAQEPGNWLHYQPKAATVQNQGVGKSWTHDRVITTDKLSEFEKNALSSGQTVVCGPSGTTTMLAFFGQYLANMNPGFPEAAHHLNTLMFVVFDGGHSTIEVLSTLNAIQARESGRSPKTALSEFRGGYAAIANLANSSAEKNDLQNRLDRATKRTVEYFATHVA